MTEFEFKAKIWLYPGSSAWHFVCLPKKISKEIKAEFGDLARGWGSLPVKAKIGKTKWRTSIFPDSKTNTYLLPVKLKIRKKEKIKLGEIMKINLVVLTEKL